MSKIQPGNGYGFSSGGFGFTLNTENPFPAEISFPPAHPFLAINIRYETAGSVFTYQVTPGVLNNYVPQMLEDGVWVMMDRTIDGAPAWPRSVLSFDATTHKSYIYLRAGLDATTNGFPGTDTSADTYPRIAASSTMLTDSDAYGHILLAEVIEGPSNTFSYNQFVTGSLWADRLKLGTITAAYYYARI
jgi:hypothetical protein